MVGMLVVRTVLILKLQLLVDIYNKFHNFQDEMIYVGYLLQTLFLQNVHLNA